MSKNDNQTLRHWLTACITIYIAFLTLDLFFPQSFLTDTLKYLGIFLCLLYAFRTRRSDTLLILALLFTFLADTILIWTNQFVFGIFVFTFAHYFHISRFTKTAPRFLIFYYLMVVSVFLFTLLLVLAPLYAIAATYAISLLANIILSIGWVRTSPANPHARAALAGFILFILCDICVAIQFFSSTIAPLPIIYGVSTYLVWLFYYPSQVLIANSSTQAVI